MSALADTGVNALAATLGTTLFAGLILGIRRSWLLMRGGGAVRIVGAVVSIIPYLAAMGWLVWLFADYQNYLNCAPFLHVFGTQCPSVISPPTVSGYALAIFGGGGILELIGFGLQNLFAWGKVDLPEK